MLEITKELETGIAIIDEQHREWTKIVNKLTSFCEVCGGCGGSPRVIETLDYLEKFVAAHFETESRLMAECKYHATSLHENQHELYNDKFSEFRETLTKHGCTDELCKNLNHFLAKWIVNHIKMSDLAFAKFYHEQGGK